MLRNWEGKRNQLSVKHRFLRKVELGELKCGKAIYPDGVACGYGGTSIVSHSDQDGGKISGRGIPLFPTSVIFALNKRKNSQHK